jgi:hypothetical protein
LDFIRLLTSRVFASSSLLRIHGSRGATPMNFFGEVRSSLVYTTDGNIS